MNHYLDYNATAPLRPEVVETMRELLQLPLNASSMHRTGRKAKSIIEDARRDIAAHIAAFPNEIVFCGSGTEANNWVLRRLRALPHYISAIEHSSIFKTAQAITTPEILPVTTDGVIDIPTLEAMLPSDESFLVSLMLANNETGVIQPIEEVAKIVHRRGGLLHCDAIQALGKLPIDFTALGCDFMTLSAHKMGGPVGAAILFIKNGLSIAPLLIGGGQELNRRAGTENVAAIAGFAKAVELMDIEALTSQRQWLDAMENEFTRASDGKVTVFGKNVVRLPNTSCIAMPGVSSETQLIRFDLESIATSAGSACSSGRTEPSHVLEAMGFNDSLAGTALRVSSGWATTKADIDTVITAWKALYQSQQNA